MKKLVTLCLAILAMFGMQLHAQQTGYFNSLAIGVNAGTTGWGIDLATPIGNHLALRAGFTMMPNFSYSDDVDVSVDYNSAYTPDRTIPATIEVEGGMGRTSGEVLLNVYPFKRASFFLTAGAVFGGDKVIKIKGHSDELAQGQALAGNAGIEIGDYVIPVDKNGNISGGVKVSAFRPYIGLGFGRIVPKTKRFGVLFEMGAQIHGTPEVYTDYGSLGDLLTEADNEFTDIMNKIKVYPVVRLRFCGKIF